MFRSKTSKADKADEESVLYHSERLEERLRALGRLLDQRRYSGRGLCILDVDDGFVVNGFMMPDRGAAYNLVQQTEQIAASEIDAVLAH